MGAADLVLPSGTEDAVLLIDLLPDAVFAQDFFPVRVVNQRAVILATEVCAVVPVLSGRTRGHVSVTVGTELLRRVVIYGAGAVSQTLVMVDVGVPLRLAVDELARNVQLAGRFLTNAA